MEVHNRMTKTMRKIIKVALVTTLMFGVIVPTFVASPQIVEAKGSSGGHSSGGHASSHTGGAHTGSRAGASPAARAGANPAARAGANPATRAGANPANRAGANSANRASSNPASRASRAGTSDSNRSSVNPATRNAYNKAASSAYNGFKSSKVFTNPNTYVYNPYINNNKSFYNYYLYSSLWNVANTQVINNSGIDQEKLLHPAQTTYWISINRGNGEPLKVLVTKSQYDKIKINDKIEVKNQKLYINGAEVPK